MDDNNSTTHSRESGSISWGYYLELSATNPKTCAVLPHFSSPEVILETSGLGFRVWGAASRVLGLEFRVQGFRLRIYGKGHSHGVCERFCVRKLQVVGT